MHSSPNHDDSSASIKESPNLYFRTQSRARARRAVKLHHYEPSNNSINAAGAAINLRRREFEYSDKLLIVEIRLPCCVTFENLTLDIWHFLQSKPDVNEESVRTVGALVLSRSDQPGSASQVRSANIIRVKCPLLRRPRMWRPAKRNESSKQTQRPFSPLHKRKLVPMNP